MHAVTAAREVASAGVDDDTVRTAVIAVLTTAGGQKLIGMLVDRRRNRADAASAIADAASVIASAAAEAVKPQAEAIVQLRAQQAEDMRDIRDRHAAAMERMAVRLGELEAVCTELRRRNDELVTEVIRLGGVASRS